MTAETPDQLMQRLAAKYTDWHFWRANHGTGDVMATRIAHLTDYWVFQKGLHRTLPLGVGHNIDLEAQLERQTRLAIEVGFEPTAVLH